MGDIDKGDAHGLLDALELVLHILPQPQIQGAQRLVQQQDLGLVDQGPGDGHPLLLAAGELGDLSVLKAPEADDVQHLLDPPVDLHGVKLGDAQAEGNVVVDVQMGEEGVALEDGVDLPAVGRQIVDLLTVKQHLARRRRQKSADDPQGRGLAAARGPQQRQKFMVVDVEIDAVQHRLPVKFHGQIRQTNQLFSHVNPSFLSFISLKHSLRAANRGASPP